MKKISILVLILLMFIVGITNSYAVEHVDSSLKIYDFADALLDDEEKALKTKIDNYVLSYDLDLVVVILRNYTGNLKTYAQDFYDYNSFGITSTHDGILLALNIDSSGIDAEIVTTGEGIRMYDDARIDSLLDAMSSVKSYGYCRIVDEFIDLSDEFASEGIPYSNKYTYIDENGEYHISSEYEQPEPFNSLGFVLILGTSISVIVATIVLVVVKSHHKMIRSASNANDYLDYRTFNITGRNDQFLTTHTTKVMIQSPNSSGGRSGGSGFGGSSISHGSSGVAHGGGGRRL